MTSQKNKCHLWTGYDGLQSTTGVITFRVHENKSKSKVGNTSKEE